MTADREKFSRLILRNINIDSSGCWMWTERVDRDGYGVISVNRKNKQAHRAAWVLLNGEQRRLTGGRGE